ncbi:MAG: hypothetical protein WB816_17865 [Methylocystis sp.]
MGEKIQRTGALSRRQSRRLASRSGISYFVDCPGSEAARINERVGDIEIAGGGLHGREVTAIAELINTQSATRADLEAAEHRLGAKIGEVEHRLELKMEEVEHRLNLKIEALDHHLDLKITALQGEMVLLKWMMGFVLAFQVAIFAKLFLH